MTCDKPPLGWTCTRDAGHDGPCAALPEDAKPAYPELLANDIMRIVARGWEPQGKMPVANYNRIFAEVYTLLLKAARSEQEGTR